jgi:adenylate kinase
MSRGPRLVLLGKQGAGKGTQAARLSERYGIEHVSTGDLFRAAAAAGTPAGREAEEYMNRGDLVPDDLTLRIVEDRFAEDGLIDHGFVLDGLRTLQQAEKLKRCSTASARPRDQPRRSHCDQSSIDRGAGVRAVRHHLPRERPPRGLIVRRVAARSSSARTTPKTP